MFQPPWYVWTMVLLAVIGFVLSIRWLLFRGALAARMNRRRARVIAWTGLLVMLGLVVVNWALAGAGLYGRIPDNPVPWIALALLVSILAMLWVAGRPPVADVVEAPGSLVRLTLPHTLRIFGGVFLVVMAAGALPAVFAIPAGLGDIAVGVAAPFVAWRLARGDGKRGAVWFNVLGAFDLVMALTLGLLAAPGLLQIIPANPTTEAVSLLPLALIPSVAVPIAITLHILSLRLLLDGARSSAGQGSRQPVGIEAGT